MKSSNSLQPFVPNKKLIIHFDIDNVLRINHPNKDLFVAFVFIVRFTNCARNGSGENSKRPARTTLKKLPGGNWQLPPCLFNSPNLT